MKAVRVGVFLILVLGTATFSGAQDLQDVSSPELVYRLERPRSPLEQIQTMTVLSMRGDPAAVDAIYQNLASPFLDVRLYALRALTRYRDPSDLPILEQTILDYNSQFTVQERIVAVKGYITIPGWQDSVLQEAYRLAVNPLEREVLRRALTGQSFSDFVISVRMP